MAEPVKSQFETNGHVSIQSGLADVWAPRLLLVSLAITVLFSLGGVIALALKQIEVPASLAGISGTALGALAGLVPALFGRTK